MSSRILFVHNHRTKFVQIDLALLGERYRVREWYQQSRAVNVPALARAVAESNLVFGWFASWHTFFPMLIARAAKKPSVLVVGGYDTANMPEIGYGSQRGGMKQWIARTAMQLATQLIAFSNFSCREAVQNAGIEQEKVCVIYLGLESFDNRLTQKENLVVTVGNLDRDNLVRKGLEYLVLSAALLPNVPIVVIGAWRDNTINHLRSIAPPNVQFTGWVTDQELCDYFSRARVYVQPSRHEGFGLAVAEAMLHECVPVVTRAGALPEVVGDAGIYLDSTEPSAIAEGMRCALAAGEKLGSRARERILLEFPLEKRRKQLYQIIDRILKPND